MKRFILLMVHFLYVTQLTAQCTLDIGDETQPICYTPWGMYATQLAPWATEEPGWTYSWSPTNGLSDPNILQPLANPSSTTTYTLTVTAPGCSPFVAGTHTVEVMPNTPAITPAGPITHNSNQGNQLVLTVNAAYGGWYKNGTLVQGCCDDTYTINFSGMSTYTDYYRFYSPYSCNNWSNTVAVTYNWCGVESYP